MNTDLQPAPDADLRAIEAERILERNRSEVIALYSSTASSAAQEQFPRSAMIRWLLSRSNLRLAGPLMATVSSSLARLLIRRFFARRA
jgi:hypothetical protein